MHVPLSAYLARRFGLMLLTVLLVPSLSFVMFTLIQGDVDGPVALARELGAYLTATFVHLDLGEEVFRGQTFSRTRGALEIVADGLVPDVQLVFLAVLSGVLGGLAAGTLMAVSPRSAPGRGLHAASVFVLSMPVYWLGFMALICFSPGFGSVLQVPFLSGVGGYRPFTEDPLDWLHGIWLPALIAGAPLGAGCARMAAGSLRTVLGDDVLRTARGKGASEPRVLVRHALPLAAPPVIALVGVNMNLLVTNVALMEAVFNVPGSFRFIERAIVNRDVDLAQALVVEATVLIVLANFLADAVHAWLDPRAR